MFDRSSFAAKSEQPAQVTYCKDIAPILQESCVHCHRDGEVAPFALTDYREIAGWAEMIAEVVQERRMPPWHAAPDVGEFANDCSLTKEKIDLIKRWVADGAPEGNRADLPEPRKFVSGWQLPREPDVVLEMPTAFNVPADGEVKYQYFRVPTGFKEDKWVSAAQILPGNRAVVHHILVFARAEGSRGSLGGERGFLFGYVPGAQAMPYPEGVAKRIPAGSELVFQVHYTPVGTAQKDRSRIGLIFADAANVRQEVITTSAVQTNLKIPPGKSDYQVSALLPESLPDCQLLGMSPHMHLRGKAFHYTLVNSDKSRIELLDVPKYDFNWQYGYRLADPLPIKSGGKIYCTATFDNSKQNLNNPEPESWVYWGDQTTDEMMIGYFDIMVPRSNGAAADPARRKLIQAVRDQGLLEKLDQNRNGRIERAEVPQRWHSQFDQLDLDKDGVIREVELQL